MALQAKRVINGTWGTVWMDGEEIAEAYGLRAESQFSKEVVNRCGTLLEDRKLTSIANTGTMMMHKVNSRMALKVGTAIKEGRDFRVTIISKLADPDAFGTERVALYGVSFDGLTLADWQAATMGQVEVAFTYNDYELLDAIQPGV